LRRHLSTALREAPSPAKAKGDLKRWRRLLSAYEAAEELARYEAFCSGRGFEEQEALEPGYDARSDAMYAALRRLLRARAPDVAAWGRKSG
jgi:hypothetical protein